MNGKLFFRANDGVNGDELWKSDGTEIGTVLVKDVNAGAAGSTPRALADVQGVLVFSANDGASGMELWRSDGTAAGTFQAPDIAAGAASSIPLNTLVMNGRAYFSADDGIHGRELWALKDINAAPSFVKGQNQVVTDDGGAAAIGGWATAIVVGPADESGQQVTFSTSTSNDGLFAVLPQIDASGKLTYTPKPNTFGTATVSVTLFDTGGTADGGVNNSAVQTFTIEVQKPWRWFNAARPLDVDSSGQVAPLDALMIINYLNAGFPTEVSSSAAIGGGPGFLDTTKNNEVAPFDALVVINALNAGLAGEGEGAAVDLPKSGSAAPANDLGDVLALLANDVAEQQAGKRRRRA